MKLFQMKQLGLGIDIGSRNIKAVKIQQTFKGPKIVEVCTLPIPAGAQRQGIFVDSNVAISLLREVQSQVGGGKSAALAFSGQNAIVREVEMPLMNDKELAEAIHWEAEKVLPFPVSEAILDWVVLERNREVNQMMSLLLVAGRADYIRNFLKPVKAVGVRPVTLSIFPMPILEVLPHLPDFQNSTTAIIDMGAEATHLLIIKDGLPRLNRTIPIGGNDFTETVSSSFSITLEEAEKVKLEYGSLDIPEVDLSQVDLLANPFFGIEEILNSVMLDVLGELKRSFLHFQQHYRGQLVEKIYLTGGAARLKGITAYLEKELHMSVELIDLTRYFACDPALEERLQTEGPMLVEALGLALSEV